MLEYFVSNFFHNSKTWIGNLVRADGEHYIQQMEESIINLLRTILGAIAYYLIIVINDNSIRFDDLFNVSNGQQHPKLLRLLLSEQISVQSVIILDKVLSLLNVGIKTLLKLLSKS